VLIIFTSRKIKMHTDFFFTPINSSPIGLPAFPAAPTKKGGGQLASPFLSVIYC
jgi:hypothetical protein